MINYGNEARKRLLSGVNIIDKTVATTLGPKGRNVAIQKNDGVHVTKDGVTVASAVHSADPVEMMAINMVREAASNTAKGAGDGTTTATIIASEIIREGMKYITAEHSPIEIVRSIEKARDIALESLPNFTTDIKDEQIKAIATISANNDAEIGGLIAEAIQAVGRYGIITVEESESIHTSIQVTEGMEFDRGYISLILLLIKTVLLVNFRIHIFLFIIRRLLR